MFVMLAQVYARPWDPPRACSWAGSGLVQHIGIEFAVCRAGRAGQDSGGVTQGFILELIAGQGRA
jgi:hypothetical protein